MPGNVSNKHQFSSKHLAAKNRNQVKTSLCALGGSCSIYPFIHPPAHPCTLPSIHRRLSIHLSMTKSGIYIYILLYIFRSILNLSIILSSLPILSFLSIHSIYSSYYCISVCVGLPKLWLGLGWLRAVSGAMMKPKFNPDPGFGWVWVGFGWLRAQ